MAYRILFRVNPTATANIAMKASLKMVLERLGHVNLKSLRDMVKQGHVEDIELKDTNDFFCRGCAYSKAHKLPFKSTDRAGASAPGEHVGADLCTMDTSPLTATNISRCSNVVRPAIDMCMSFKTNARH